jgi:hypothetical protein
MIQRYTIKFSPAVSQKELQKALQDTGIQGGVEISKQLHMMKAKIEVLGTFEDLKKLDALLKELSEK